VPYGSSDGNHHDYRHLSIVWARGASALSAAATISKNTPMANPLVGS
jgi:hypothetical protein